MENVQIIAENRRSRAWITWTLFVVADSCDHTSWWQVTSRKPGKRTVADLDEDGDVVMGMERRKRRERGGKRIQKKKRKGPNGAEIDMEDVEVCNIFLVVWTLKPPTRKHIQYH